MEQMNKEEIIEFFIEQLGDNKVLGKIMSIEQIREKLNYIIRDVKYDDSIISFANAFWYPGPDKKGILNFDLRRIKTFDDYKRIIVHELLHALSTKIIPLNKSLDQEHKVEEADVKIGLQISENVHFSLDGTAIEYEKQNCAINEGMTDTLAEMITGIPSNSYSTEKNIYKIVSFIVGEDNLLKEYFSENISKEKSPLDIFKEDLIEKYGEYLGKDINEALKKVLKLSDILLNLDINSHTIGITERNRMTQEKIKNEISEALENIISELIEYEEPDIMSKVDDILILLTSLNGSVSKKILRRFFENETMNSKEKQSMAHSTLKKYFESNIGNKKDWNLICDLYLETGNITQQMWSKKRILKSIIEQDKPETIEEINDKISQIRYRQVGDYYMILCDDKYEIGEQKLALNEKMFDENGMLLQSSFLWSSLDKPASSEVLDRIRKRIFEEKFKISQEQDVKNLMEQLRGRGEDLKNKVLLDRLEGNKDYMDISIVGNLFKIQYIPDLGNEYFEFYSINSDGLLEQVIPRRRKKICRRYVRNRYRITKTNCKCVCK